MDMIVTFPGNLRVAAEYKGFTIETDQPQDEEGDGSAPAPFDLFLASLATCAGVYMLQFLRKRRLPVEGASLIMRTEKDERTRMITNVVLNLHLPPSFPEKYREAIVHAVNLCAVKKHLLKPPEIAVITTIPGQDDASTHPWPDIGPDAPQALP